MHGETKHDKNQLFPNGTSLPYLNENTQMRAKYES